MSKFEYYRNRARALPPAKLAQKIVRRATWEVNTVASEFRARLFRQERGSAQVLAAPAFWCEQEPGGLFLSPEEWRKRCELLCQLEPAAKGLISAEADRICDHIFDLLGSGPRWLGETIDWHVDFKSGYRFNPKMYYKRIHPATYPGGYDIKIPWELSRCHHLTRLGQAWQIIGNEKYAREFITQVGQWIKGNPYPYGVNWASSMEIAIRAVNWLWGLALIINSPSVGEEFLIDIAGSLFVHGQHIMDNLERPEEGSHAGNHYLANLVGLVYLGICCPFFTQAKGWLAFGASQLWKEALRQVNPDGASNEGSIPYHRFVTEMLLSTISLCKKNHISVPQEVMDRIGEMLRFTACYSKPDGTVPIIGDQDNGRLHRLGVWSSSEKEWLEHSSLLEIGAHLLPQRDLYKPVSSSGESIWLVGGDKPERPRSSSEPSSSHAFPVSGFHIMRHRDLHLVLRTGANEQGGLGGHMHNDILSFELYAYDKTFITDTGTFTYTNDFETRNRFRSSRCHNVLVVDDEEINLIPPYELFRIDSAARVTVRRWQTNAAFDLVEAEHSGYQRLKSPVQHHRGIYFDKRSSLWILRDDALGIGCHRLTLYFHFAPMDLHKDAAGSMVWTDVGGANLGLYFVGVNSDAVSIEEGCVSPSYGIVQQAPVVKCRVQVELPHTFLTVLYPWIDKPSDWARALFQAADHPWLLAALRDS